jgi:predicted alpha/beta superfamily hydrolase
MRNLYFLFFLLLSGLCDAQVASRPDTVKPFILGRIETLHSTELKEDRILNIYLPEGYDPKDTIKYPVVYLLDGSADEDFIHVVGLFQFSSFSWVGRVKPSIIVGIANTDRKRDFTYPTTIVKDKQRYPSAGHSDVFIRFLEKELQPYITKHFRTNNERTLIGESLGGLFATEILFKKPELFTKYIIISPSLWWDNGSLLSAQTKLPEASFSKPLEVYIGVGKEGLTPGEYPRVMEVDANLLADKIRQTKNKTIHVYFDYLPQEDHATIAHQSLYNAILLIGNR